MSAVQWVEDEDTDTKIQQHSSRTRCFSVSDAARLHLSDELVQMWEEFPRMPSINSLGMACVEDAWQTRPRSCISSAFLYFDCRHLHTGPATHTQLRSQFILFMRRGVIADGAPVCQPSLPPHHKPRPPQRDIKHAYKHVGAVQTTERPAASRFHIAFQGVFELSPLYADHFRFHRPTWRPDTPPVHISADICRIF